MRSFRRSHSALAVSRLLRPRLGAPLLVVAMIAATGAGDGQARAAAMSTRSHGDGLLVDRLREMPAPPNGAGRALVGVSRLLASAADVRAALPGLWCGVQRSSDDTEHELANGDYRIHAIYLLPSDAANRFETVASTLQADAFQASALLERLYGRAIRFDLGTACGPQYLDISVIRVAQTTAALSYLAANADRLLETLASDLRAQSFAAHGLTVTSDEIAEYRRNFLVWLEGVAPPSGLCGIGGEFPDERRASDNLNNFGGQLAVVFRSSGSFCDSNTVRHEIAHNLGALQAGAPHAFDGAHCDDAYEDTMCYPLAPRVAGDGYQREFFDYRNDDYWDPAGGALSRWTVNLSRFICPDVACNTTTTTPTLSDILGRTISGLLVSCPTGAAFNGQGCAANTTTDPSTEVARGKSTPLLRFSTRRLRAGKWRALIRVTGAGTTRVTVTCKRAGRKHRILSRRLTAPRRVRAVARCDSRPRASTTS